MTLLNWREEFKIGVPAVDHEHRELIALINRLYDDMLAAGPGVAVNDYLGEIHARISAHFALEERLMREARYDRYAEHKTDHERLLDDIRDIMDEQEDSNRFDATRLAARLSEWFGTHFKTHDAWLHRHLPH